MADKPYMKASSQRASSPARSLDDSIAPNVIGASDWANQVRYDVVKIARHHHSVLISGPNGTGKEILARAIHHLSPRRNQPFIPVDCAAFVGELFPSHMFGHVKGAFTGADYESLGCIRAADGGTLFLDEIGELEPALQAKLLRVLQERIVVPVGGVNGTSVNIRLICATNRDLQLEVARGNFRQDLFYRLNVVQLRTLSLKDRIADIAVLAEHFLAAVAGETGMPRKSLSSPAQVLLNAYPWPGNVRQLKNILERAVVFTEQEEIEANLIARLLYEDQIPVDTSDERHRWNPLDRASTPRHAAQDVPSSNPRCPESLLNEYQVVSQGEPDGEDWMSLSALERLHIVRTLEFTGYNQTEAARLLDTTSRILVGKIRKYGIDVSLSRRGRPSKPTHPRRPR